MAPVAVAVMGATGEALGPTRARSVAVVVGVAPALATTVATKVPTGAEDGAVESGVAWSNAEHPVRLATPNAATSHISQGRQRRRHLVAPVCMPWSMVAVVTPSRTLRLS